MFKIDQIWGHKRERLLVVVRSQQDLAHLDGAPAELAVFRRAWAVELPWVVLAKSESLFTGCTVCSYLQGLIDSCPRDQKVVMKALRARLGKHFSFQGAQRLAIQKIQESARRSDGDEWILGSDKLPRAVSHFHTVCLLSIISSYVGSPRAISIDKMDQNKCKLPCIAGM